MFKIDIYIFDSTHLKVNLPSLDKSIAYHLPNDSIDNIIKQVKPLVSNYYDLNINIHGRSKAGDEDVQLNRDAITLFKGILNSVKITKLKVTISSLKFDLVKFILSHHELTEVTFHLSTSFLNKGLPHEVEKELESAITSNKNLKILKIIDNNCVDRTPPSTTQLLEKKFISFRESFPSIDHNFISHRDNAVSSSTFKMVTHKPLREAPHTQLKPVIAENEAINNNTSSLKMKPAAHPSAANSLQKTSQLEALAPNAVGINHSHYQSSVPSPVKLPSIKLPHSPINSSHARPNHSLSPLPIHPPSIQSSYQLPLSPSPKISSSSLYLSSQLGSQPIQTSSLQLVLDCSYSESEKQKAELVSAEKVSDITQR